MAQTFGTFVERKEGVGEYLKIGFFPTSIPLQQRWKNNGLSADFLAGYLSTFFPGEDSKTKARQNEIRDAISYIANELLENAMKFSHGSDQHSVSIEMFLEEDVVSLYATNCVDPGALGAFQVFLNRLLTEDPDMLYMEQLESNAEDDAGSSGLGFLTMLNDYGAALAWQFADDEDGSVSLTTMVQLDI
ncbi:MAG: ATP-binding protein [Pseudomonadota bacterium]